MNTAIAWFARNPVAANLMMLIFLVGGFFAWPTLPKKVFPDLASDVIEIRVPYPGASPRDVEQGLCMRVEDSLDGLAALERVSSTALEGLCITFAELVSGEDVDRVLGDAKSRIDAIDTFPLEAEEPVVRIVEQRYPVTDIALYGDFPYASLRELALETRRDLLGLPGITAVSLVNDRTPRIDVELSESGLRAHRLTFDQVADAIRSASLDLPGGVVKTPDAELLVRGSGQALVPAEFERLVLRSREDGTRVRLGDVATVVERPDSEAEESWFNGQPAVSIRVFRVGSQDAVAIKEAVDAYVGGLLPSLPPGVQAEVWLDTTDNLRNRVGILLRNGRSGFLLVLLVLALFLRPRLAFWVGAGVPISLLGALGAFDAFALSIDPISVFAFIVVLGLLVDDAIVVGESVHRARSETDSALEASTAGAQRVMAPVVFGVLTSVAAFAPMLAIPGGLGGILRVIAAVAILCLVFSILESLFVLPAHLAHDRRLPRGLELSFIAIPMLLLSPPAVAAACLVGGAVLALSLGPGRLVTGVERLREGVRTSLQAFEEGRFRRAVEAAMRRPAITLCCGVAFALVVFSWAASGRVAFYFFPPIEADWVMLAVTLEPGTSRDRTREVLRQAETAADRVRAEIDAEYGAPDRSLFRGRFTSVGGQPLTGMRNSNTGGIFAPSMGSHIGEVSLGLVPPEQRDVTAGEIAELWRGEIGIVPDALTLDFGSDVFATGAPLGVRLEGNDLDELERAAEELMLAMEEFPGVYDASHSFRAGKQELRVGIRPEAEALGLSFRQLALQVRQALHGEEVQRFQRGSDEVEVRVRLPRNERRSLGVFDQLRIRTREGRELPFHAVADIEPVRGYAEIRREQSRRIVDVTAEIDRDAADPGSVLAALEAAALPEILSRHPGIGYRVEGEQREQGEFMARLMRAFGLALLAIYALLAIPLRSYLQPLLIMAAIPFGIVGAIVGHVVMSQPLSLMSMFGFVALTGVVVNASLVLLDAANRERRAGRSVREAYAAAAGTRLRPILLTTLTTFFGLTPLMLERSTDAMFLVPTAVSLAWGVLFASAVTLLGLPAVAQLAHDLRTGSRKAARTLVAKRGDRLHPDAKEALGVERS